MDSRIKELITNTFVFGFGLVGAKLIQFLLLPFFTNYLTTSEYGVIELLITLAGLLVPIVTLQIADSVLRFGLSKKYDSQTIFQNTIIILSISSLVTIALSFLFVFWSDISEWRVVLCFIIILQSFRTNFAIFSKTQNKNVIYSIDGIIYALFNACFNIIAIKFLNMGILGYLLSEIVSLLISIIFLFFSCNYKKQLKGFNKINSSIIKEMIKYSSPLVFNGISWWIASFSDRMILSIFHSVSFVGIYSVAAKIPAIITTGLSMFTQAWIVSSVKEYEENNREHVFQKVYNIYTSLLFVCVTIAIIVIKPFLDIYIGKEFHEAWKYVPLLLVGVAFLGISNYFSGIYVAAKQNVKEVRTTILCAIINISFNFLLIPEFGINGAVIATLISYVSIVFLRMKDVKNIIKIRINIMFILLNLVLLLVLSFSLVNENVFFFLFIGFLTILLNVFFLTINLKKDGKHAN